MIRATAEAVENKVADKVAGPVTKGKTAGAAHAMKTREMSRFHRVKKSPSTQAPEGYPSRGRVRLLRHVISDDDCVIAALNQNRKKTLWSFLFFCCKRCIYAVVYKLHALLCDLLSLLEKANRGSQIKRERRCVVVNR